MLKVILSDTTGTLEVTFFNQEWLTRHFTPGRQIVISGRISEYLGRLTIIPEEWEDLDRELLSTSRIVPVYPANADLRQKSIRKLTAQVVQYWAPKQPDPLPAAVSSAVGTRLRRVSKTLPISSASAMISLCLGVTSKVAV